MCVWALHGMFPMPQDWMLKTYKNWSEANQTKWGFHTLDSIFASDSKWSHSRWAYVQMTRGDPTLWPPFHNFVIRSHVHHLKCVPSSKLNLGVGLCSWVKGTPNLALYTIRPCTFFRCWGEQPLCDYAMEHMPTLHTHFDPILARSKSFRIILGLWKVSFAPLIAPLANN